MEFLILASSPFDTECTCYDTGYLCGEHWCDCDGSLWCALRCDTQCLNRCDLLACGPGGRTPPKFGIN